VTPRSYRSRTRYARFELLVAQRSGSGPRHRTLGAVIHWSYRLLSEPEQLLFARLHVFAATFDIAAVEAGHGRRAGTAGSDRTSGRTVGRAVAADPTRLRRRHAEHLVALAERAGAGLLGPDEERCARRLEDWLDDTRAAWTWARDHGQIDLAMRLVAGRCRPDGRRSSHRSLVAHSGLPPGAVR
jgi:predicted ATPase